MKKELKGFVLGLIVATLLMGTVFAGGVKQAINVVLNSVNLTVNNKKINADNILYNGTTYVPLRAVAEALGKDVGWDEKTNTASINDKGAAPYTPSTSEWKKVKTFEGNAIKDTETFKITSDEWRIVWETEPGDMGEMNFQVYVYKADGTLESVVANVIGKGNDTSIVRGSGDYYLSIVTAQPYKITIEQK